MKGVQMMYDITKFRRSSNMFEGVVPDGQSGFPPTSPSTPALSVYTIDDEFNLPVSVAFIVLVIYIIFGAIVFCFEEGWGFFESFYFVFISMSTIGFGDFVPKVRRRPLSMYNSLRWSFAFADHLSPSSPTYDLSAKDNNEKKSVNPCVGSLTPRSN